MLLLVATGSRTWCLPVLTVVCLVPVRSLCVRYALTFFAGFDGAGYIGLEVVEHVHQREDIHLLAVYLVLRQVPLHVHCQAAPIQADLVQSGLTVHVVVPLDKVLWPKDMCSQVMVGQCYIRLDQTLPRFRCWRLFKDRLGYVGKVRIVLGAQVGEEAWSLFERSYATRFIVYLW